MHPTLVFQSQVIPPEAFDNSMLRSAAALLAPLSSLDWGDTQVWSVRGTVPGLPAWEPVRQAFTPQQAVAAAAMRRMAYGAEPGMRALLNVPWCHSAPNGYALGIAQGGGTLFVEERFDAERTLQLIHEHRLTHAYLVPTMYVRLLALPAEVRAW